jgi:2-hydroxychromene-2-carboxylate isomerase
MKGNAPCVHYFHEVSDPYSHIAIQKLDALRGCYSLPFEVHLVSGAGDAYRGDASRYPTWALNDAASVAGAYGVSFPPVAKTPSTGKSRAAEQALAALIDREDIASSAVRLGEQLWLDEVEPVVSSEPCAEVIAGNDLRAQLGHYAGAMFYFDGEWYWGLDRLFHLEQRLIDEGYGKGPICVPRPGMTGERIEAPFVTLEYFPSLRSPYTAISFDRTMEIADRTGVTLNIRPVMPMMMRGVQAPREKASYIMFDAAREGRAAGEAFGRIIDPFGEPVRRAFSLLPLMLEHDKVREFTGRYLKAAWMDGIDVTADAGLERVVTDVGIDWSVARESMSNDAWEGILEDNVNDMLALGLWGVPSFRVSGGDAPPFSCWGQDRLWRVEREIVNRHHSKGA